MSKKITYKIYKNIVAFLGLAIFFSLTSCEEDLTKANQNKKKNFPSRIIYNANIIKRDSGQVKVRFKAPLLEEYEFVDTPYVEIRKGLYLEFYDSKKPNVPGKLWAKYAKIIEKKQFYEAKGHVKVINNEGQTFVMESIYWDKANRKMYTKDTVFITDKDGSIFVAANGMKAKDDFTEYVFYNNSGDFNVKKMPDVKKLMENNFYAIGLMSGTSLDGLDICYVKFEKKQHWNFEILHAETVKYPKFWEEKLKNSIHLSAEEIAELNSNYGFYLGEKVNEFISKNQIKNIDLIASHGHTVFHQPQKKFTLQIGDGRAIKLITKIPVIYDFRMQDVLMGGNGAPLVPIGDELLFQQYDACLNLGGFSNISLKVEGKRIAFDICPVNIVLNSLAQKRGQKYDEDGKIARLGKIDSELLNELNNLKFYRQDFPKSLGIEWVLENVSSKFEKQSTEDLLATFTEHSAIQIANTLNQFKLKNVLITGGGTYHSYLIEKIKSKTSTEIIIPEKTIINYKEALIFAFMGVLKINNETNVLSSATGSYENHSSGIIA